MSTGHIVSSTARRVAPTPRHAFPTAWVYGMLFQMSAIPTRKTEKRAPAPPRSSSSTTLRAASACYERRRDRIVVVLSNGLELAFPPEIAEGLAGAKPADLSRIEITPTGLGLHWRRLDADLYLPALLEGAFGTRRFMAASMGKAGGKATTASKQAAARANGKLGGRPRKIVAA